MDVTQILGAFNLNNGDKGSSPQQQQNVLQNLSGILGNQLFKGEALQVSGNTYTTQVLLNPQISDATQELSFKANVDLRTVGNFSVDVENINFTQTSNNTAQINFTGKIIAQGQAQNYTLTGSVKITDPKLLAAFTQPATNNPVTNNQNILTNLTTNDTSNFTRPPNNLQAFVPQNTAPLTQFLGSNTQNITQNSLLSLNLNSITTESGEVLLQNTQNQPQQTKTAATQNLISGKIEYQSGTKETLIKTDLGNFRIEGKINIPNNSTVTFKIDGAINETITKGENFTSLTLLKSSVASDIANLQASAKLLSLNPAGSALLTKIFPPNSDKQSYARSLSFISGAIKNDLSEFTSKVTEGLYTNANKTDQNEFLEQARMLFQGVKDASFKIGSSGGENYYSYILPFYNNGKLDFQRFYVSHKQDKKNPNNSSGNFVIELEENPQGRIEIEGNFDKNYDRVRKLETTIRSESEFTEQTRTEMRALYTDIAGSMGFTGSIGFLKLFTPQQGPYNSGEYHTDGGIVI